VCSLCEGSGREETESVGEEPTHMHPQGMCNRWKREEGRDEYTEEKRWEDTQTHTYIYNKKTKIRALNGTQNKKQKQKNKNDMLRIHKVQHDENNKQKTKQKTEYCVK
jgi:hypothetical protein